MPEWFLQQVLQLGLHRAGFQLQPVLQPRVLQVCKLPPLLEEMPYGQILVPVPHQSVHLPVLQELLKFFHWPAALAVPVQPVKIYVAPVD